MRVQTEILSYESFLTRNDMFLILFWHIILKVIYIDLIYNQKNMKANTRIP
jgi:hypothetical protein